MYPRSIISAGTDIAFSSIMSWNSWRDVYVSGFIEVKICGISLYLILNRSMMFVNLALEYHI